MKRYLLIIFLFFNIIQSFAQLDTKHWFAPMVDRTGNPYPSQRIYLSTNRTTPFEVKIYNNNLVVGNVTISKGNPGYFVIPRNLIITSDVADLYKPVKMGLYLEADYAYFANLRFSVANHAEIITSKGRAGIGDLFYTVMAPITTYNDILNFMTSVLATEDNTVVKISNFNPNIIFSDGVKRSEFNITLNKGESYIIEGGGNYQVNYEGFIGAKIESDKPISVTNGNFNGQYAGYYPNASDILMDQNVPVQQLGKDFVLVKGNGAVGQNMEGAIVVATKDNTEIYVNNESVPLVTINEGEYFVVKDYKYINQGKDHYNLFIQTTEKAYVYQLLAGSENASTEATGGMNFIPALNCFLPKSIDEIGLIDENPILYTNNNQGGITKIPTKLNLITEKGAVVTVNGSVPNSNYGPFNLTGTTDWVTYGIPDVKGNITIKSDKAITGGITAGSDAAGYGGFFAGLPTKPKIVAEGCFPDVTLTVTPDIYETYQWFEDGVAIPGATEVTFKPTRLGNYSVEVTIGTCPPLKDEYKLRTCPDESELEFETCGVAPIHITPKFTKSAQTINFNETKIVENPSKGVVTINTVKGIITYTPNKGQKGYDEFKYIIYGSDKFEDSEIVTVKILINELIVNNATVYACNVNGKGIFDLSDANVTSDPDVTKNYYPTKEDAENEVNEIIDFEHYESTNKKVYVVVKNKTGCKEIAEIQLEFFPFPQIDLTKYQTTYCGSKMNIKLDEIIRQIFSNRELFTVKYYLNEQDALDGNTNTISSQNIFTADTKVYVRIETLKGCQPEIITLEFKFGEKVKLNQEVLDVDVCDNDFDGVYTFNLNDYVLVNFVNDYNYDYKFFETFDDAENNINSINSNQVVNRNKTFYVRFEKAGLCFSIAVINTFVSVPEYSSTLKDVKICPNTKTILDAGDNYLDYKWSTGETTQTIEVGVGDYWVELLSKEGCPYVHNVNVSHFQLPNIVMIKTVNGRAEIIVEGGTPPYKYSLNGVDWQSSNVFEPLKEGNYTVYVISADNCTPVTKDFFVNLIPNFISPNNDGYNDSWRAQFLGYKNAIVQIFDRYGAIIKDEVVNDEYIWDGKKNGFTVPSDSYWYRIKLNDKEIITGYITVKNK
ncbi:T9SS type B sorting domain-containing protein [Empedobacter falsenii]|uniref:T9SS type B sorting domain-containing protein n=1 Tax=Empedobacter falsenii TaxID=343874 RepID=A0A7H9DPZ5_9FLAO|nr:T9SS type B sorting domain-containing protein [Empedobacter falsenii]QLL56996.1 T9SS type B sorting domain-containing protein [Empedobacter falsenii]